MVAMIFLLVASVITMTIRSAKVQEAGVMVRAASLMALDSVFADFDKDLFEDYGILLLNGSKGETSIEAKLSDYMSDNLDSATSLTGVDAKRIIHATDENGMLWQDMAVDYEKYTKVINLAADYLDLEDEEETATAVSEASEKITECAEQVVTISKNAQSLVQLVDGIDCSGVVDVNNLVCQDNFIKRFAPFENTKIYMEFMDENIYKAMKDSFTDPREMLDDYGKYLEDDMPEYASQTKEDLTNLIASTITCSETALAVIDLINEETDTLNSNVDELTDYLSENLGTLDSEVFDGLMEETDSIKNYRKVMAREICDVTSLEKTLKANLVILNNLKELVGNLNEDNYSTQIQLCKDAMTGYSFTGMMMNYQTMCEAAGDEDALDKLEEFLNSGVLALAMPKDKTASDKTISSYTDLASSKCSKVDNSTTATAIEKKIIYIEYVMDNFSSFTDEDEDGLLNYEIEYLLYGQKTDEKNLSKTVTAIATLRSGINMTYLITDTAKREEAYGVATALMGWTGLDPLVRIMQFAIMYLWAYGEGIVDARTLLEGGKVPFVKSQSTWKLSLTNLMAMNLTTDSESNKEGVGYETYLRFLLYTKNDSEMAQRTMDLVELDRIKAGDTDFRLADYIFGIEMTAAYEVWDIDVTYTQKSAYTY